MPEVKQHTLVPYSAKQMYDLVNDYAQYPQFLSGCVTSRTFNRTDTELTAELTLSKAGVTQRFTTHNTMEPPYCINIALVEGAFKHLRGQWRFEPLDEQSCQVHLFFDFEFANPLVQRLFSPLFTTLMGKMVQAFKNRAKEVYGV